MTRHPACAARTHNRRRGFTILELIVTLLILGVISLIAVVGYNTVISNSKTATVKTTAQTVARNANAIAASNGMNSTTSVDIKRAVSELPGAPSYANMPVNGVRGNFTGGTFINSGTGYEITQSDSSYCVVIDAGAAVTKDKGSSPTC